ncbi:MAG: gliding motility-associated C-terminal domain-containing protein [Fluviicola sp.]
MKPLLFSFIFICFNFHSQIVINEINLKPSPDAIDNCIQSLKNCSSTSCGNEYVEFYNNSDCPVDISCFIFVSESFDGARDGAFRFPSGTILPPRGFTSIGGPNSGATFDLSTFCSDNHLLTNNARWYLDNGDAWVALYNDIGTLIDAVFWTAGAGQANKWPSDSDLDDTPPYIPSGSASSCPSVTNLTRPINTVGIGINEIEYAGVNPPLGQVLERTTDGQNTWASGLATINTCNGICVTSSSFIANATVQQPTCGTNNGSISFAPLPSGSYNYLWSPNVSSSNNASSLNPGSYTVTIEFSPGCTFDTTIVLSSIGGITSANALINDVTCGQQDGQIEIQNIIGGNAPYQVNFNGAGFSTNLIYPNLSAGNYSVLLQDAFGCQFNLGNQSVLSGNGPTSADLVTTNTTCSLNNGSISITTIQGGLAPYSFSLNGGSFSSNSTFLNLSDGNYSVTIQDVNQCEYQLINIAILGSTNPSNATVQTQDPTCGNSNGELTISNIIGGSAPYEINFNNQGFLSSLTYNGIPSGTFPLIIRDQNGCELILPDVVLNSSVSPQDLSLNIQDATCSNSNGSVSILGVIGGIPPYQFSLNGGTFTNQQQFNSLDQGNYTLTVIDDSGCTFSENVTINGSNSPTADFNFTPNQISSTNTTLNLLNNSSNDVVSFNWSITNCTPTNSTSENPVVNLTNTNASFVSATLTVTNSFGCIDSITKIININADFNFYAPNSFTPDGDEYNNEWNVFLDGVDMNSYQLLVFNRWGELILESNNSKVGWDGTYNNELVKEGVYVWIVTFKDLNSDKKYEYKGHLTLVR